MALDTYSELKSAVSDWMARSDLSGNVADWIKLAESRLNRQLDAVEVDQSLTGTASSREIDTSSYAIVQPVALYMSEAGSDEIQLIEKAGFPFLDSTGRPKFWDFDRSAEKIIFDRPLDTAYSFRLRYRQKFALSDSVTTNWLLENYPDIYLAATLVWGGGFVSDFAKAAAFKSVLDEGLPEVRSVIAQSKRSVLTVDRALSGVGRRQYYNGIE